MRKTILLFILWMNISVLIAENYKADWNSLDKRPIPEWFQNAKFGIFVHWGLYSVPAWAPNTGDVYSKYAEWYWHRLNPEDKDGELFRVHHEKMYGKDFRYQDFAGNFKAEMFNP